MRQYCFLILVIVLFRLNCAFGQCSVSAGNDTTICLGSSFIRNAVSSSTTANYQWYISGSPTIILSSQSDLIHTPNTSGVFNYVVRITNGSTCTDFDTVKVTVNPKPNASFNFSPSGGCGKTKVSFTNTSNNGDAPASAAGLTYLWNFGDGSSSTQVNPGHTFNPGRGTGNTNFTVRLIITNSSGCKDTVVNTISIGKSPDPTLNGPGFVIFNGQPYFKFCSSVAQNLSFTNASSTVSTNTQYIIRWGDGTPNFSSTSFNGVERHLYSVGTKKLTFIVYSGACVDSSEYNVFLGNVPAGGIVGLGGSTLCAGDSQKFVISGIANNPIGTFYTIDYKDGTGIDTFYHPAPDTISHIFPRSSCGVKSSNGSQIFNESYGAYLSITNPCGSAASSVVPIFVSDKPDPEISATRDSVCEGQIITFTNIGNPGNNVENQTCTPGKLTWKISSSTSGASWTISSGALGNDFGDPDPNLWISGTPSIGVKFNTRGTYQVKLIMANNTLCGMDSSVKIICVNPLPTADYNLDKNIGCAPFSVNAAGITNTPTCGTNKFEWAVSFIASPDCPQGTSGFSFVGGTNANSQNPQFQFTNPGTYTISLQTIAPGGACSSQVVQKQIIVKSKPVIGLNVPVDACQNAGFNPTATAACFVNAATYLWEFTGATSVPANLTALSPGPVNYANPGLFNVKFSATNECGTTTLSPPIDIKPTPEVTVPADAAFCPQQTAGPFNFISSITGANLSWTNSNNQIGLNLVAGTGSIPAFTTINNGPGAVSSTINVTPSLNGCTGASKSLIITVNPRPQFTVNSASVCAGDSAVLTASGNATTYTWTPATGLSTTSGSAVKASPANTTTYTVTGAITSTSCSASITSTVTIKPIPAISVTGFQNPTTCGSSTGNIIISGLAPSTSYLISYNRDNIPVSPFSQVSNSSGVITIGGLRAGNYDEIRVTLNGCASNKLGPVTLADPNPPVLTIPSSDVVVCAGQPTGNITFSANSPTALINWTNTNPNIGLFGNGTGSISSFTALNNGTSQLISTISVSATLNGCTSASQSMKVVVNPLPQISVNSPTICSGNNTTLNVTGAADTYTWSPATGLNTTSGNTVTANPVTTTTYIITGNFSVTGCQTQISSLVTVKPTPSISISSFSNPVNCASSTGSIVLSGLTPSVVYVVRYLKGGITQTLNNLQASSTGIITIPNLSSGTYSDIEVVLNSCPSNKVGPVNLLDPTPPATPVIANVNPICSGNTLSLSASTTSAGTATWRWTGPNNFFSNEQNPSIANATTLAGGNYSITVTINNCTSAAGTKLVVVEETPVKPVASSNSPVCSGNPLTLTASTTSTMPVSWSWSGPNGFSSTNQNPTVSNAATTNMTGDYTATVSAQFPSSNLTCSSTSNVIRAEVRPTPLISASIGNPTNCATATGSIILSGLTSGSNYQVRYTKGVVTQTLNNQQASSTGIITIPNLSSGTYTDIEVVLNGCPSNKVGPFTLVDPTPPATPVIANVNPICSGNTLNLNASTSTTGTATWSWTGPNNFSSNQQNPSIANATTLAGGTYSVTVTINNCTSAAGTKLVVVEETPAKPVASSNSPVCSGNSLTLTASTTSTMPVSWSWSGPNSFSSSNQNPIVSNAATTNMTGDYTATVSAQYTSSNLTCSSTSDVVRAEVRPTPVISANSANPTNCATATGSITVSGLTGGSSYTVNYLQDGVLKTLLNQTASPNGNLVLNNLTQGNYRDIEVILNGCPSNKFGPINLVDPNPPVLTIPSSDIEVCAGQLTGNITFSPSIASSVVNWTNTNNTIGLAGSGTGSISSFTTLNNTTNTQIAEIEVSATLNSCTSALQKMKIIVHPRPVIKDTLLVICSEESFDVIPTQNITGNIIPANTTYTWTVQQANSDILGAQAETVAQNNIRGTLTNLSSVPQPITYLVIPKSGASGNCDGPSFKVAILVNPKPQIKDIDTVFCSGDIFSMDPSSISGNLIPSGTIYKWSLRPTSSNITGAISNGIGSPQINGQIQNNGNQAEDVFYDVTPVSGNCPGNPFVLKIRINPLASVSNTPLFQEICTGGTTASVIWTSPTPGASFSWKLVSAGSSITGQTSDGAGPVFPSMLLLNPSIQQETVIYSISSTADKCSAPASTYTIYVNPDSKADFTYQKDFECWPFDLKNTALISNASPLTASNRYEWYADDQLIGTTRDFPGYTINNPNQQVEIKLIALSQYGCKADTIKHLFRTRKKPAASFTSAYQNPPCAPLGVNFTNTSEQNSDFEFLWIYGYNNQSYSGYNNPASPNIIYPPNPNFGDTIYKVQLISRNICFSDTAREDILVSSKPKTLFVPDKTTGCSPLTVSFKNVSRGIGNSYVWDFGDGSLPVSSNDLSITHTFITGVQKIFKVKLIATNPCGVDEVIYDLLVIPNPIKLGIFVNGSEVNGCAPHSVNFNNNSSGSIGFEWDFGDGTKIVTDKNNEVVPHVYNQPGLYNVKIKAISVCSDTTGFVQVRVFASPVAAFTSSVSNICVGKEIQFQNTSTGTLLNYNWNFGDGSTSVQANPVHQYQRPGIYTVTLTTTSVYPEGTRCSSVVSKTITIIDELPLPQDFYLSTNLGTCVPFTVNFENRFLPYQKITWLMDGNPVITGQNQGSYTFTKAGSYILKLVVEQAGGCKYAAEKTIEIKGLPLANVSFQPPACVGQDIEFKATVQSEFPIVAQNWEVQPINQTFTGSSISVKFLQPGVYTIKFTATTDKNCVSVPVVNSINVYPVPVVKASPDVKICKGGSVNLSASSPSDPLNYTWFPTQGLNSTNISNPVATPAVTTTYTVKGTNQYGCAAYAESNVQVIQPFDMEVSADAKICIGQSVQLNASGAYAYKWSPATTLNRDDIQAPVATPTSTTTYKVIGTAELGCFPVEKEITVGVGQYPVVRLAADTTLSTGTLFPLISNISNGPIVQWNWQPPSNLSCKDCPLPVATIKKNITYKLTATNEYGCSGEDEINIKVFCENTQVYIPNAFTPGTGTGSKNDVFFVQGKGIMQVKSMRVYNRWGELVFEKTNVIPNDPSLGWNGTVRGVVQGPDVYGYIVEVLCDDGTPYFYKGNITLLK